MKGLGRHPRKHCLPSGQSGGHMVPLCELENTYTATSQKVVQILLIKVYESEPKTTYSKCLKIWLLLSPLSLKQNKCFLSRKKQYGQIQCSISELIPADLPVSFTTDRYSFAVPFHAYDLYAWILFYFSSCSFSDCSSSCICRVTQDAIFNPLL